ncbi:hypothetical protein [Paenibacillus etheri]|uniref:Uncharacterized protein n=1 Tax=Paenibacillus etheri TaxID=1306852 RepID=A0A0W1B450_9BACL|nr:hypothetical protein [Paenibacillus etheri]KTD88343.1 hypothetical protein UQ64_06025 [Paenibacillus etheri]
MSWIYIVAVIIFAVVSNVNKAAKNKPKGATRGGMPTFGGGEENPLRRNKDVDGSGDHPEQSRSGFPTPVTTSSREYDTSPAFPEPAYIPTPDYTTEEGMSLEYADDGVELRTQKMQEEVRRIQAAFDGIAGADPKSKKTKSTSSDTAVQSNRTANRDELRNGVVWAEILGPPRARQPHSTRRT